MAPQRRKSGHIFAAFMAGPFNMKLRELSVLQDIQALQLISVNQSFASYQILKRMIPPLLCVLLGPDFSLSLCKRIFKNKKVRRAVGVTIIPTCVCV